MESRIKELEKENQELKLIIQLLTKEIEELKANVSGIIIKVLSKFW